MAIREPSSGELNRRVLIRLRADRPTGEAGVDSAFSGEVWRWAKIEPVGTAVFVGGIQTDVKVTDRITFRVLAGMTEDHEVVHGRKIYRVKRVADLNGAGRFTMLEVELTGAMTSGGGIYV
ncbi:head-tail adaptor protein [Pseudomonas kermanshahensis]|uniref:head-tail adaptor protein n=1 Tax=Pseudomonas kermanshahensis TaxID=2745482 RepID=UPI0023DAB05D|nr:head-tail adaptor protein [Pseudomonas kermanshahensis]WEL56708.1 head-tail adaptor protein [Pseudomonas kermanshahensis]